MKRYRWRVVAGHSDAVVAFPFAIVDSKGQAVALVKTKEDAKFLAEAARVISRLDSDRSTFQRLYYGKLIHHS